MCDLRSLYLFDTHFDSQAAAHGSEKVDVRGRALTAGREVAMQYRELLQLVMHTLSKPSVDAKQHLGNISSKIAQCVRDLATAAEQLKDDDWVDPSDPTFIAENELLGAANSIESAARKLSELKPRREIKGKVSARLLHFLESAILKEEKIALPVRYV